MSRDEMTVQQKALAFMLAQSSNDPRCDELIAKMKEKFPHMSQQEISMRISMLIGV